MAYTNKVAAAVVFLAVVINLRWTEAQTFPKLDRICKLVIPDILDECFESERRKPTNECCDGLKNATSLQVDCLCDNYIASPTFSDLAKAFSTGVLNNCGVSTKFLCQSTKNKEGNNNSTTNGNDNGNGNVGAKNKVAASVSAFGLVATIFFVMF